MKSYLKALFLTLVLFLIPISLDVNLSSLSLAGTETVLFEVNLNTALAVDLNCDTGLTGLSDGGCQISEGILFVWELLWFYTSQVVLVLVGYILDIFIFLSIDDSFYRSGLIERGWEILRDFTNILFIFSFLVMAFRIALKLDEANTKKQLMKTILVALTVNFSLFISLAVIDASNLLAYTFYNKIEAKGTYQASTLDGSNTETTTSISKFITEFVDDDARSISLAIAGNVNPQLIITGAAGEGFLTNFIIITGAGLINVLLIYIFFQMISVFLGRTLGLMFSSMLSAVAFTSLTIPGMQNKPYIGFNKWLEELISTAFMAPVFLFFIYLAVTFLKDKGFLAALVAKPEQDFLSRMLVVFIPFLIIGGILMLAKKISGDMVGELGKMAVKGTAMLAGGVVAAPFAVGTGVAAIGGGAAVLGGAAARGAGMGLSRLGASRAGASLMSRGHSAAKIGRRLMSFKADPTKLPGFKTIVGKEGTQMIGKVTGKSVMGHLKDAKDKRGKVFSNEHDKLNSDKENQELKNANNAAAAARKKAEAKYEADLYSKRFQAELARKKLEEKKDGFTDSKGNKGGYKEATEQSKKETKNIDDLSAVLKDIKKQTDASEKDAQDKFQEMNKLQKGTAEHEKAKQEWQQAVKTNEANNKQKTEVEVKLTTSKANKQTADKYIENISTDYNAKQQELTSTQAKQKAEGDLAEKESRNESAANASSNTVAQKITKSDKLKGNGLENAIKKVFKEQNIKLDDDK